VDLPAPLIFGNGWKGYERPPTTVLKFTRLLGKFSISDTAHNTAHQLFRQRQQYQRSAFKANPLPAACQKGSVDIDGR